MSCINLNCIFEKVFVQVGHIWGVLHERLPKIRSKWLKYDSELLDNHIKTVQKLDRSKLTKGNKKTRQ